jgi:hypothetical protein
LTGVAILARFAAVIGATTMMPSIYILPEDLWYIIPKPAFRGQASVALRPAVQNSKYAKYLGAWQLLKPLVAQQSPV